MFLPLYLLQMAETKKMFRVKVVCQEILYHPSNFLPSLKTHPVYMALRVETANPVYFFAYIIRLRYKVADFVMGSWRIYTPPP